MKPILFNTEMVRAILEGRKTVTRRVVKFKQGQNPVWSGYTPEGAVLYGSNNIPAAKAPFQPGDILWVRETWQFIPCIDCRLNVHGGCHADPLTYDDGDSVSEGCFVHRADYPETERINWKPSIHMPREAARIFLRVKDMRVERLHEIDDNGVVAEGLEIGCYFDDLWDRTIKSVDRPVYGWDANPWVWVIEFEQISKDAEAK